MEREREKETKDKQDRKRDKNREKKKENKKKGIKIGPNHWSSDGTLFPTQISSTLQQASRYNDELLRQ